MKITTKTGDKGETGLFSGKRVSKGDLIIEVLGSLDELQSFLGFSKVACDEKHRAIIDKIQDDLYKIMAIISGNLDINIEKDFKQLEGLIEQYEISSGELNKFIKPGENEASARIHVARTICRRAEREFVRLKENQNKFILLYLNRLSDFLFLMSFVC
jgi:cob(I)alamin adenosyltransferase